MLTSTVAIAAITTDAGESAIAAVSNKRKKEKSRLDKTRSIELSSGIHNPLDTPFFESLRFSQQLSEIIESALNIDFEKCIDVFVPGRSLSTVKNRHPTSQLTFRFHVD